MDLLLHRRINEKTQCWEWTGSRNSGGYGWITFNKKGRSVHRVSAHLFLGFDLNSPLYVLHRCDNPACFNPEHLFIGTHTDNMRDEHKKGRSWQAQTTHCPQGHPYSGKNLRISVRGDRLCRECIRRQSTAASRKRRSTPEGRKRHVEENMMYFRRKHNLPATGGFITQLS